MNDDTDDVMTMDDLPTLEKLLRGTEYAMNMVSADPDNDKKLATLALMAYVQEWVNLMIMGVYANEAAGIMGIDTE